MNIDNNNEIKDKESLTIKIIGFSNNDILVKEAGLYNIKLKPTISFWQLSKFITNLKKISKEEVCDILINDFSIKNNQNAKKYIQQNCLILSNNCFLNQDLSVQDNIKIISIIFTGFDLSNAVISSFNFHKIKNEKVKNLPLSQQNLVILSYCVACPALIWLVDNQLLDNLSQEEKNLFNNAVKIRIKQGGVVAIISK